MVVSGIVTDDEITATSSVTDGFRDGATAAAGTALDPLGIGRRLRGDSPDDLLDYPARGFQTRVTTPTGDEIAERASITVEEIKDAADEATGRNSVRAFGLLLVAGVFAVAFGQLFTFNLGN